MPIHSSKINADLPYAYSSTPQNKWYFIDQDFDQTMGVSASAAYATAGRTLTSMSYKQYGGSVKGSPRPILDKILAAPKYAARFEQIIKAIVQHTFNPIALGARFEANHARIRDDVQWDRSQPRRHTGRPDNWVCTRAPKKKFITSSWELSTLKLTSLTCRRTRLSQISIRT